MKMIQKNLINWESYSSNSALLIGNVCPCCGNNQIETTKINKGYETEVKTQCSFCGYCTQMFTEHAEYDLDYCKSQYKVGTAVKVFFTEGQFYTRGSKIAPKFYDFLKKIDFEGGSLHLFKRDHKNLNFLVAIIFGDSKIEDRKYQLPQALLKVNFNWQDKTAIFEFEVGNKEIEITLNFEKTTEVLNLLEALNKDFPPLEEISEKLATEYK